MYRPDPSSTASGPMRSVLNGLAAAVGLGLVGVGGLLAVGYYLPAASTHAYWFISRSSGIVAYVLITASVLWGLVQSGGLFRPRAAPLLVLGLHSYLSWLGLGLAALHGIVLLGDSYMQYDLLQIAVPFTSTYRPVPVGLGVVGFYLMLLLSVSFYARRYVGQKNFRLLHYASFLAFVLATLHGVLAGTDTGMLWSLYSLSLLAVVVLTALRVASTRRRSQPKPAYAVREQSGEHKRPVPSTLTFGAPTERGA